MHQQIRQGDSLTTPFTLSSPPPIVLESEQTAPISIPKKPLDFILPFAVAANMNGGLMARENLRAITAELGGQYSVEKTEDNNFYLLDFLMTEARLPFAEDFVKPWTYQGWLLPFR